MLLTNDLLSNNLCSNDLSSNDLLSNGLEKIRPAPPLESGEVHLWQRSLAATTTQYQQFYQILAEDELQRAKRFHFDQHRIAFVTARGTLRSLLGAYLQVDPATIAFVYNDHGKPALPGLKPALQFNISHSDQWSIYAITQEVAVGVDVQRHKPAPVQERLNIVKRFFSKQEFYALSQLPTHQVAAAFFAGWTRKEAVIKCHGSGLALSLATFSVTMEPDITDPLLVMQTQEGENQHFYIYDIPVPEEYHAALALATKDKMVLRSYSSL